MSWPGQVDMDLVVCTYDRICATAHFSLTGTGSGMPGLFTELCKHSGTEWRARMYMALG